MCRVQHLNSKDLSCYLNEIEPVGLRKCPYGHLFANREYLRSVTVTYIYRSFTYNVAGVKNMLAYAWNEITSLSPCVYAAVQHSTDDPFRASY